MGFLLCKTRALTALQKKRTVNTFWLILAIYACALPAQAATSRGYAAIVLEAATGAVVSETNADRQLYPASLTKMMTVYLLFEALERGEMKKSDFIRVSSHATAQPPTKIGLTAGSRLTVEDAIQAIITRSANDIAVAVGEYLGGTESGFAEIMTKKAREIGMTRTTFRNASGLPDPRQNSTARDMSTLARRLILDFPQHYHYFGERRVTVAGRMVNGHNKLMERYPGMDGMKTGYINASGYNLVSSASRGGVRLIGVVFGGRSPSSRDKQMAQILDKGFRIYGVLAKPADKTGVVTASTLNAPPTPKSKPERTELPEVSLPPVKESKSLVEAGIVAPPPPPAEPSDEWAVQVGAYRDETGARIALSEMMNKWPQYKGASAKVAPVDTPLGKLYRAQITGLDEEASEAICAEIRKTNRNCLILAPGQTS